MTFIILDSSRDSSIPPISESIDQLRHNSSAGSRVSSTIQKPQHFEGGADSPCPAEGTNWDEMRTRLRTHVEESLPSHYIPDHFIRIDGYFPLTPHGKLDKKLLLQMGAAENKANTVKEIRNPWTFALHLWKIHLPDPPATIVYSDNFISLGGDSLAAVRAINSLESACQDSLPEFVDLLINKDFGQFVEKFEKYLELKRTEDQLSLFPNSQNVGMSDSSIQTSQENKHSSADGGRAYEAVKQLSNISESKSGNSASLKHKLIAEEVTGFKVPRLIDQESSLETQSSEKAGHHVMISQADRASTAHAQVNDSPSSLKGSKSIPECSNCGKVHSYQHKLRPKKIMSRGKLWQQHRANISGTQEHFHHMNTESRQAERGCDHNKTIRDGNKLMNCEANFSYVFNKLSPHEAKPPMTLTVLWKFDTKKCVDASPLVVEYEDVTLVFIGSHSGQFSAIDVHSGKSMWSVTLPDRIESTACCSLDGAYIIVGCYDNSIYVLEAKTGSLRWKFDTKDTVKCSPVVNASSGHIMCGSHDGHLYCLDLEEKVCKWKCHLGGGSVFSSPTVDASKCVVYAASLAGKVSALCTDTGAMKWTTDLHKPVFSSLCLLGDSVVVGCVDGSLYCLSSVGHIEWTFQTQAPIFSTAIVYGSSVLVGSHDHHLYCLNRNGQLVWRFYASSAVYATAYVSRLLGHEKGEEIPGLSSSDDGSRAFTFKQDDKLKPENYFSKEGNAYSTEMKQCNTNSVLHHSESLPEQILDPWKIIMQPHHPTDIHDVKQSVSASKNSIGSNDVEKSSPWNTCPSPEDSGNTEHTGGTHHETVTMQQNMDSSTICKDKILSKQQKTDLVDLDESLCSECGGSGAQHASVSNHEPGSVELSQCSHHASVLPASVVVTPSTDGNLYILDLVCGKLLAHVELPGEVFSSPVIVEDFVITGCRDNFVYCFQIT